MAYPSFVEVIKEFEEDTTLINAALVDVAKLRLTRGECDINPMTFEADLTTETEKILAPILNTSCLEPGKLKSAKKQYTNMLYIFWERHVSRHLGNVNHFKKFVRCMNDIPDAANYVWKDIDFQCDKFRAYLDYKLKACELFSNFIAGGPEASLAWNALLKLKLFYMQLLCSVANELNA